MQTPESEQPPPPPSPASIVISLLILFAAAATIALFMIPASSPWFWPVAGLLGAAIALGMVIPIKPKPN